MTGEEVAKLPVKDLCVDNLIDVQNYMASSYIAQMSNITSLVRVVCVCGSTDFSVLQPVDEKGDWQYITVIKCSKCGEYREIHEG